MNVRMVAVNLLNVFTTLVESVLGLRFVLKLFGADTTSEFVTWVYNMSEPLLAPFRGIFPAQVFENRYVLEFTTLFAMLMFAVLALVVLAVVEAVTRPAVATVVRKK